MSVSSSLEIVKLMIELNRSGCYHQTETDLKHRDCCHQTLTDLSQRDYLNQRDQLMREIVSPNVCIVVQPVPATFTAKGVS